MRLSIQRLRWVLIAGALLLVGVLTLYIGYGRYRALRAYRQILARSGVTLTRDSNGVTWSQSVKGKKLYTVRAKVESNLGNGQYALHDAEVLLYTRSQDHPDHMYGSEMEYDQNTGVLHAKGEVFMDLQPPQGLTNGGHAAAQPAANSNARKPAPAKANPEAAQVIHVRTSGLVYVRKSGLATTDQQVEFSYGGMQCTALGAEFNSNQNTLRLLANVHMDGLAHGQPLHVVATRADMDRNANLAHLTDPVVTSNGRTARSDTAILNLRKDGSIEHVQGIDHVVLTSATRRITANRLDGTLNPQSIPETGRLSGNVVLVDTNPLRPTHGSASVVDAAFNAQGTPTSVVATGAAKLSMVDRRTNPAGLARSMDGARIVALFLPGKRKSSSLLKEVHATGSAHAGGQSVATPAKGAVVDKTQPPPVKYVQVWADDLRVLFTHTPDGKAQPQTLHGTGHTILQQDAPLGEQEISTGDTLEMAFASTPAHTVIAAPDKDTMNISSAVQTGHITIHDRAATKAESTEPGSAEPGSAEPSSAESSSISTGTADRATYDGSTQKLTLIGNAHLYGDSASVIAPTVSLDQRTQDAEATGGVQATFQNASQNASQSATSSSASANAAPAPLTHVLSASAHFEHATRLANFYGTDAHPALMWQGGSQVQAAILLFDGVKRTFSARPAAPRTLIHAVFASNPTTPKPGLSPRAASILRVASPKMDYNDLQREATFTGGVNMDGTTGEVRGQRAEVFLVAATKPAQPGKHPVPVSPTQPSPLNGSIDRVVVSDSVQIDQPGRHGTGEQLLYTAASGSYVLTGTPTIPPHIVDAQQGNVTGATLLFSDAGSTIVVAGDPGSPKGKGGRVRTETHVSPAKEERQ
jgi:lipopolysaccharide export system protein LptA